MDPDRRQESSGFITRLANGSRARGKHFSMRRAVAMKLCYVLDSHALLACFQAELGGAAVRDLLRAALEKKVILADLTR
jgi:hypothetical protein